MSNPYREIIQSLDDLVKSRFIEMFGNPLNQTSEFEYVPIKSFSKCVAGATPSTLIDEYWNEGTIPWLSSGEVNQGRIYSTEKKITQKGYDNCSTHIIPAHTVLIALAGQGKTRGTVAVTEIELCTNQSICSIITDKTVEADYLYQALKIQYDRIRSMSNGDGGRGGLNLEIVGKITVPKPPIELQQQFADFVKQVDKSKFIAKQAAEKYDQLVKSRFIEMFGDIHNPKYGLCSIDSISVEILAGGDKPSNISDTVVDDCIYPVFANATENKGLMGYTNTYRVGSKAVTISARGAIIGYCEIREACFTPVVRLIAIVPSSDMNLTFLKYMLEQLDLKPSGSGQPQLIVPDLRRYMIIKPPINLQDEFESFVQLIDKSKLIESGGSK